MNKNYTSFGYMERDYTGKNYIKKRQYYTEKDYIGGYYIKKIYIGRNNPKRIIQKGATFCITMMM